MSRLTEQLDMTLTVLTAIKLHLKQFLVSSASAEHLFLKYEFISKIAKINREK